MQSPNHTGMQGFIWFFGKVEDRDDPLQLGRVRVRPINIYPEEIETQDLPWALCINNIDSSGKDGVGITPLGFEVDSYVFGFFADGKDVQQPIVLGSFAGYDDINKLAIGENIITKTKTGPEPDGGYGAQYPYNKVTSTESGHIIETDDTPNAERLHLYHKGGSYRLINNDSYVIKSVNAAYFISVDNMFIHSDKDINVTAQNETNNIEETVTTNTKTATTNADSININGSSSISLNGGNITADGDTVSIKGSSTTVQGSSVSIKGGPVAVTGSAFTYNGQPVLYGSVNGGSF